MINTHLLHITATLSPQKNILLLTNNIATTQQAPTPSRIHLQVSGSALLLGHMPLLNFATPSHIILPLGPLLLFLKLPIGHNIFTFHRDGTAAAHILKHQRSSHFCF
jgi:hypothetical protein